MLKKVQPHLTYANVASTIALCVAIGGGTAYAFTAAKDSVTSRSIRDGAVKTRDLSGSARAERAVTNAKLATGAVDARALRRGSVDGLKVADDSLTGLDVDESTLDRVPTALSITTASRQYGATATVQPFDERKLAYVSAVQCPSTWTAVGGGYYLWTVDEKGDTHWDPDLHVLFSENRDNAGHPDYTRWEVWAVNTGTRPGYLQAQALCVPVERDAARRK
jgi:hypothetical protein